MSSGGGARAVLTEQNRHPRVQVSPINIIVAVAEPSPPPQHSPIFGQRASLQGIQCCFYTLKFIHSPMLHRTLYMLYNYGGRL